MAPNPKSSLSEIRFDNFGQSVEILCRFLFYSSYIYQGERLTGYFYGRSWGFWGATNCVCCLGGERIRFRNVKEGVNVFNILTHEKLLLRRPDHKFSSRINGRISACLSDNSEIIIELPKVIVLSQASLPVYVRFKFEDGKIVRVLLYGRGSNSWEMDTGQCFNRAIPQDGVENLLNVQTHISTAMILSLAMYLRMYAHTRWLL